MSSKMNLVKRIVMRELYFLKIGGSVITETNVYKKAKIATIRNIMRQIKEAKNEKEFDLIIGHGGGSFPHIPAKKYRVNEGLINKNSKKGAAITHIVANSLNNIVVNEALNVGLEVFPFSPSSFGLWNGKKVQEGMVAHISESLKNNFIPVVYGDVVMNSSKGVSIASTEDVFTLISQKLKPDKIIIATDVDGVFDKNPKTHKEARLIKKINSANISKVLGGTGGSQKVDVTGGMHSKLELLYKMVKATKSQGIITNGLRKNSIKDAFLEKTANTTIVE